MKNLDKYIEKHGRHLTVELSSSLYDKWSAEQVESDAQKMVYYNVSEATLGDMHYLVNMYHEMMDCQKARCLHYMIGTIGNYGNREIAFEAFIDDLEFRGVDLDFTPYI